MTAPTFCVRCKSASAVVSARGLCPTCDGQADDTSPRRPPAGTRLMLPSAERPTAGFVVASAATPWHAAGTGFPDAPEGYQIRDTLGPGGMGVVYRAVETATGRQVAIKYPSHLSHGGTRERFRVEVQTLAALRHPNLVTVYAVVLDRTHPYFIMELADGGSLSQRVRADGPPPFADAARLLERVARAMHAAHAANVVHRDLKPSNVLLFAPPGGGGWSSWVPKVGDFGLAKRLDAADPFTYTGQALGTPGYMPPEQFRSKVDGPARPTADVYAIGATLYDLLTGEPPYRYREKKDVETIFARPLVPPSARNRAVPAGLEAICLKCLDPRPSRRYPTAAALADDLARWQQGQTPEAPPLGRVKRAWGSVRRRPSVAAAVAVAALAVAGIAAVPYLRDEPVPAEKSPAAILADIHAELEAGRRVTLLSAAGSPRLPVTWDVPGPTAIVSEDEPLTFEALDLALLQLLPDPGVTGYRVRADLRILASVRAVGGAGNLGPGESPLDSVGLYVGHTRLANLADGPTQRLVHAVTFNDYVGPKLKAAQLAAKLEPFGYVRHFPYRIDGDKATAVKELKPGSLFPKQHRYPPVEQLPGLWRRLQVEVSPADVVASWIDPATGAAAVFGRASAADIAERYAALFPDGRPQPVWQPRRSLGVWCKAARVAIKDVMIEKVP